MESHSFLAGLILSQVTRQSACGPSWHRHSALAQVLHHRAECIHEGGARTRAHPAMASSTTPSMAALTRISRDLALAVSDISCARPSEALAVRRTMPSRSSEQQGRHGWLLDFHSPQEILLQQGSALFQCEDHRQVSHAKPMWPQAFFESPHDQPGSVVNPKGRCRLRRPAKGCFLFS